MQPVVATDDSNNGFIYVKSDKKMIRVALEDILYIEGLKDYVKLHLPDKSIITYRTLTYFEEKLSSRLFLRVHRSYIVALNHISAFTTANIEIGRVVIPIGKAYGNEILKRLASD